MIHLQANRMSLRVGTLISVDTDRHTRVSDFACDIQCSLSGFWVQPFSGKLTANMPSRPSADGWNVGSCTPALRRSICRGCPVARKAFAVAATSFNFEPLYARNSKHAFGTWSNSCFNCYGGCLHV